MERRGEQPAAHKEPTQRTRVVYQPPGTIPCCLPGDRAILGKSPWGRLRACPWKPALIEADRGLRFAVYFWQARCLPHGGAIAASQLVFFPRIRYIDGSLPTGRSALASARSAIAAARVGGVFELPASGVYPQRLRSGRRLRVRGNRRNRQ